MSFLHVTTNYYKKFKISKDCSIFSAEAIAILRALAYIDSLDQSKNFLIVSDSQSVLKSIQNFYKTKSENYLIYKICDIMCKINKIVELLWCPSHVGIQPNEFVDSLAKQAITDGVALNMGLTYVDAINSLKKNLLNCGKHFGTPLQNRGVLFALCHAQNWM